MNPSLAKAAAAFFVAWLCIGLPVCAQPANSLPKLLGTATIGGRACVVLEVMPVNALRIATVRTVMLRAGERESALEVKSINPTQGTAELRYHGSNVLVRLPGLKPGAPVRNEIEFVNMPLWPALRILSDFSGRTVLEHPALPRTNLAFSANSKDRATLAVLLAAALTNVGIVSIADGDKFLRVVPAAMAETVQSQPPMGLRTPHELKTADDLLSPGVIDFTSAKGDQVAKIYAELIGKKLDPTSRPPHTQDFRFRSHQSLTRAEMLYALDVQFAWRGVKFLAVDDELIRVVRLNEP